jgi:hypothetical protein
MMNCWQDAIDKGIPMTEFSHLGINKRADITAENIDELEQVVANYNPKK